MQRLLQAKEKGAHGDFLNKPLCLTGLAWGHRRLEAGLLVTAPFLNVLLTSQNLCLFLIEEGASPSRKIKTSACNMA